MSNLRLLSMESNMDSCMFSPSDITSNLSSIFPTNFCGDTHLAILASENNPRDLQNPLDRNREDKFYLPSHQESCFENMSKIVSPNFLPLLFPGLNRELDRELSIFHLLKAYGEATEKESTGLAKVILTWLHEKASPFGTTMERLSHYLLVQSDTQSEQLRQECNKNYAMAFRAFYEITPYSRFAHFVANSAIHESVPRDVKRVHIIDFFVGDGIQWPPLLSSLGSECSVRITCINMEEEYRFQRTKKCLTCFAQSMGLNLIIDQLRLPELLLEKRRVIRIDVKEKEWLVFNCMVGLPHMHMANMKGRNHIEQFIEAAQELIVSCGTSGILTYGTGSSGHKPFSDSHLLHSHALFESLEWHFPSRLSLARTSMECLFVGTSVSCFALLDEILVRLNLQGCRLSKQNVKDAMEIAGGGNYGVKVRGDFGNEMVLEWRGTVLVRVCALK